MSDMLITKPNLTPEQAKGVDLITKAPVNWEWYNECAKKMIASQKEDALFNQPIPTGFTMLDELVGGGFKKGELIILSAPTKQGKSTLAQTISWNMAQKDHTTLWFTMEMSWQELTVKFMAMDERYQKTKMPSLSSIHYPTRNCYTGGSLQIDWLKTTIKESIIKEKTDFVIIDHLHFLLPLKDYSTNVSFLIGSIVREIKKMAVELQIPIMLIAHTTKLDMDKAPDINSIRDSSFIAQEADFVMMMWRIRDKNLSHKTSDDPDGDTQIVYTNKAWLSLEANRRNGKTGRIKLWHNGNKFLTFDNEEAKFGDFTESTKNLLNLNEPKVPPM